MRLAGVVLIAVLSGVACADRLIDIPTGSKIPYRDLRVEYRFEPSDRKFEAYAGVGIGTSFELELKQGNIESPTVQGTFDLTYNYIAPLTQISPGISAGIQDVLNRTEDGRKPFVAATFRRSLEVLGGDYSADYTVGVGYSRKRLLPFAGAALPLGQRVRLLAEHDGWRLAAGVEVRPAPNLNLKLLVRNGATILSGSAGFRF